MRLLRLWTMGLICLMAAALAATAQEPATGIPEVPAASSPRTVRVSGGVMAGQALLKVPPIYPMEAKMNRVQGTVVLHAIITREGRVLRLEAISGPEVLRGAAMDAVRQWTYRPYILNGEPTDVDTTILINFNLAPAPPA